MIFRPDLAQKILAGEKTVTRRMCSENEHSPWWRGHCSYEVGQVFSINPGRGVKRVGNACVTRCERMVLGRLSDAEAALEGFESAAAFEKGFAGINGEYDPTALVWRIAFEALP